MNFYFLAIMALTRGAQAMDIIALPDNKEVVLGIMSNICPLLGEFNTPLGAEGEITSVRTTLYPVVAMPTLIVLCWSFVGVVFACCCFYLSCLMSICCFLCLYLLSSSFGGAVVQRVKI